MTAYRSHRFRSADGRLELFARDYPGGSPDARPLLLMHALTRNSADFEPLIEWLLPWAASRKGGGYRLIVPDVRGRGLSGSYRALTERFVRFSFVTFFFGK